MQLIATFTAASDFQSTFDADAENRGLASLTMLQMWHDADDASGVLCLFEVNDRAKANSWVAKARFGQPHRRAVPANRLRKTPQT